MMDAKHSRSRKEYNLRYQMRQKGYRFSRSEKIAMLPDDSALRSELQERRIMELGYAIQLNMFDQENANK